MSKTTAIFARTPVKNVKSSPASSRQNSASKTARNPPTPTITVSSPRKCTAQTDIQNARGDVNIRSRLQLNFQITRSSPSSRTGVVKSHSSRGDTTPAKTRLNESESGKADEPAKVNVKSMRSCFEKKEAKVQCRPPPSPSPSRAKCRLVDSASITPRNTNSNIRGILTSRSKYDGTNTPSFRIRSGGNTPTPRTPKLRRSVSTGALANEENSSRERMARSSSQTITPKHVKFLDEGTPECFSPVLLESRGDLDNVESVTGETTNLTVAVRVRPPFPGERSVVSVEDNMVRVKALGSEHCFSYDFCFPSTGDSATSQQDVFHSLVEPLVDVAFQGYNVCLFAYGQTGSGKSYSMMGEDTPDGVGIIPRFSQQLFKIIESSEEYSHTKVEISYFEIYNEKIHDLLGPAQNGRSTPLRVREHPELGPYVVDLTVHNVHSFEILQDWLRVGNNHKATAATDMNMNSSRSHCIFTVTLTQSQAEDRPSLCSKINLIDLAGSERLAHTGASGDRLKEGVSINRSLLSLGKVISSLSENKKRGFIPYRESVLTWLLRESLGGNSRTAMLATINPSGQFVEETLSTLRYACQARNIVNTVRINESPNEKKIRELLEEIQMLKDGINMRDHAECLKKVNILQQQLNQAMEDLSRANIACGESEVEVMKLKTDLAKLKKISSHDTCEKRICQLEKDLTESVNQSVKYKEEIKDITRQFVEARERNLHYEDQISKLRFHVDDKSESNKSYKKEVDRLEQEVNEFKTLAKQLRIALDKLDSDLAESRIKNNNYEKDIFEMKNSMLEIKNITNHDSCDSQILMLQTALDEAEKFGLQYKEKNKVLEKKCLESKNITNHDGCEKEISVLKDTISELKKSADHRNCDSTIEKLKTALTEAERLVGELETEINKLIKENTVLQEGNKEFQMEIASLQNSLKEVQDKTTHTECEDRINTLKKALSLSKSMNTHVQCENRITELEMEVINLQSVTLADHSKCDEKINNLFFAVEEYAEKHRKLIEHHDAEILQYKETIQNLENKNFELLNKNCEKSRDIMRSNQDLSNIDTKMQSLKEENCRIKKRKVDDEKKVSSLEQQVTSLTKELLDLKSQLRFTLRAKESSESLCAQLREQVEQQERKLAALESSSQLSDNKENWETPSKVIRRSIAQHSLWQEKQGNDRCSLVMKAEEIHQALKDAEDICLRLKIPYVFQLEPEVTTHSWFDVNVRVWDQRTTSSVRWPRDVFLTWLRDIKEDIMSKSRGHKLFCNSPWLQKSKDSEVLATELDCGKEWQEELKGLGQQIAALEHHSLLKDKREVLSAVAVLKKAVDQLNNRPSLSSPLRPAVGSNC